MSEQTDTGGAGPSQNTTVKQPWETLGFDSFEAYEKARVADIEKLRKQVEDKEAYIKQRDLEIGELRKKSGSQQEPRPDTSTPAEPDDVTKEAERTLRDLAITMPPEQKQRVNEALASAEPNILKIVKSDPQSRLVFMRNVLGEEFQLPKPNIDIFDGIGPEPVRKPLHEQLQDMLNAHNNGANPKPYPSHTTPRTSAASQGDPNPEPPAKRYKAALQGGLEGLRAKINEERTQT